MSMTDGVEEGEDKPHPFLDCDVVIVLIGLEREVVTVLKLHPYSGSTPDDYS